MQELNKHMGGVNMLIKNTSISIKYKKIDNLKISYFMNKEKLDKHFNEATVLPIPDDAPLDIPRIIIKSSIIVSNTPI